MISVDDFIKGKVLEFNLHEKVTMISFTPKQFTTNAKGEKEEVFLVALTSNGGYAATWPPTGTGSERFTKSKNVLA